MCYEAGVQLHSFVYGNTVVPFAEETIPFSLNGLGTLVKNQLAIDIWVYFWTINFITLVYISIPMPIPHCSDYYSFVLSFEIRKCELFNFVVPQNCFDFSGPLAIPTEFKDQLFYFCKKRLLEF